MFNISGNFNLCIRLIKDINLPYPKNEKTCFTDGYGFCDICFVQPKWKK